MHIYTTTHIQKQNKNSQNWIKCSQTTYLQNLNPELIKNLKDYLCQIYNQAKDLERDRQQRQRINDIHVTMFNIVRGHKSKLLCGAAGIMEN